MTDVALFKMPADPGVRRVRKGAPTGASRPVWTPYKVKAPIKCDDCLYAMYEAAMEEQEAPPARFARQKRYVKDVGSLLLCDPHARIRKQEDAEQFAGVSGDARTYNERVLS